MHRSQRSIATSIASVVLALALAGCGDDDPGTDAGEPETLSSSADSTSASPTTTAPPEITADCELAARNWHRAAFDQYSDGVFGVTFAKANSTSGPADRVQTYCPSGWSRVVAKANYELALLNANLRVCEVNPTACDQRDIDKRLDKLQSLLGQVQELLDSI